MATTRAPAHITVATLRSRGWTDALIRRHLGDPDRLAPNPHYSQAGGAMRLYALARVEAAESGTAKADLADAAAKRIDRQVASAKAVGTKTAALIAEVDALTLNVARHPWDNVRAAALDGNQHRQMAHEPYEVFVRRMVMNYLRHECTNYHHGLASLFARVGGRGKAYEHLRHKVEDAILDAYPELSGEG